MADAPEVVPDSLSAELSAIQQPNHAVSPLSPNASNSPITGSPLSPNDSKSYDAGSPDKGKASQEKDRGTDEKELFVPAVQNDENTPKTAVSGGIETEDTSPKYPDDRPTEVPPYTMDAKVAGDEFVGQRAIEPEIGAESQSDQWHVGLFDCCNPGSLCVESAVCPCIIAGRTALRLRSPNATHFPSTNGYCTGCFGLTIFLIVGAPLYCIMTTAQRQFIRNRYHIAGNGWEDCFKATFCVYCALVQEEKEVIWREEQQKKGFERRQDRMEYQPQPGPHIG